LARRFCSTPRSIIDVLQGKAPDAVEMLLAYRTCHHSSVCLAELTHIFGRLDPTHPGTKSALAVVKEMIDAIADHRLHAPDTVVWGKGGMMAGALARLGDLPAGESYHQKHLNDALVVFQAMSHGLSVLTGNVRDYDYLEQLLPGARVIFYRHADSAG
jgi:predicted nucleic acid-binding protein